MADGAAITIACPPTEADARLIAAAPDLLAAMEGMMAWRLTTLELLPNELFDQVRAAIAKALGD